jgi:hypothetical protein
MGGMWQVNAHWLLNKKTSNVLFQLGVRDCWRYLRLQYFVELFEVGQFEPEENPVNKYDSMHEALFIHYKTPLTTTCILTESGASMPICTMEHFYAFTKSQPKFFERPWKVSQTSQTIEWCSHCVMCGKIIRHPTRCMLHHSGDPCPEVDIFQTVFTGQLIQSWTKFAKDIPSDDDITAMDSLAEQNPELTAYEIAIVHWNLTNPN